MNEKQEIIGYIHLYTGNGKGKTTAAMGLAVRAVGAGKKVFIGQFVKGMHYAELESLKRFPEIVIRQYGLDCFIKCKPTQRDIDAARHGLEEVTSIVEKNMFDMVILDEVCIALYYKLFSIDEVLSLIKQKPKGMEIVLTGRYAPDELIEAADLVTEMKEIKHYYNNGIEARKGIEY
jgi:cob(I)alamin adenosyltransferase